MSMERGPKAVRAPRIKLNRIMEWECPMGTGPAAGTAGSGAMDRFIRRPKPTRPGPDPQAGANLIEKQRDKPHSRKMQSVYTGPVFVVRDNIDTDQIIPAQYLNFGANDCGGVRETRLLCAVRFARIAVSDPFCQRGHNSTAITPLSWRGRNFGCGSSREHAPIALGLGRFAGWCWPRASRAFSSATSVATGELYPCEIPERLCEVLQDRRGGHRRPQCRDPQRVKGDGKDL